MRLAEWWLERLLPPGSAEPILGDLREEYAAIAVVHGRLRARAWYWSQAFVIPFRYFLAGWTDREGTLGDLRLALRRIRKAPGFAAIVVLTLAIGIGANAVVLSVADAIFLRSLPYPADDRLVLVSNDFVGSTTGGFGVSYLNMRDIRERVRTIEDFALFLDTESVNMGVEDGAHRVVANFVTPNFFPITGLDAAVGRQLSPEDNQPGAAGRVAVLSNESWRRLFGSDPRIVGKTIRLNGLPYEVVGVLESQGVDLRRRFRLEGSVDVFVPLFAASELLGLELDERRELRVPYALARLAPGVDVSAARRELRRMGEELAAEYADVNRGWSYAVEPVDRALFGDLQRPILAMVVGAVLLLTLVCINLVNLVLVRTAGRGQELAIRRALGARSGRVLRQLAVETLLLSVVGGIAGGGLALWSLAGLSGSQLLQLPGFTRLGSGLAPAAVTFVATVGIGVILGFAAASLGFRGNLAAALHGARASEQRGVIRARRWLIAGQVALAFVLLVAAGLMFTSFQALRSTGYGFDTTDLAMVGLDLRGERYDDLDARRRFADALDERLQGLPGVQDAFVWSPNRPGEGSWVDLLTPEGQYELDPNERIEAWRHGIQPGALRSLGIPLLRGRGFAESDGPEAPPVAIVSETLARDLWPGEDPIGKAVDRGGGPAGFIRHQVVGVVGDARHRSRVVDPFGPQRDIYYPYDQRPARLINVVLRTEHSADLLAIVPAARRAVGEIDPTLPIYDVTTMEARMWREESRSRASALLLGLYAAFAVVLAGLGLYGVLADHVRARTREIGVRMAMGASIADVIRRVVGQGMATVAVGAAVGLALALGASRLVSGILYGVDPWNLRVYGAVTFLLAGIALAACVVPALWAARVDPTQALRAE